MSKNLLVTGSIALDRIAVFEGKFSDHILPEKVHTLNVSFPVNNMTINYGGAGANIAYNLALMGDNPLLMGTVGHDAKDYVKNLVKKNIDCTNILEIPEKLTAHASIMTDLDDNQITAFYVGAMGEAHQLKIPTTPIDLVIIAPNEAEAMIQYAQECLEAKIPFIADPGQAIPAFSKQGMIDFITGAQILICNDYEWEMIQEKTGLKPSDVMGKVNHLIITYGKNGSKIWEADSKVIIEIPAVKTEKIVDPTGCGDAYRAGLMYGLKNNYFLEQSGKIGAWIASKAVEKSGTQNHQIDQNEFKEFITQLQK